VKGVNISPMGPEKDRKAFGIKLIVIAIVLIGIVATAAAVMLFTHTFPAISPTAAPPSITTSCSTLTASSTTGPVVVGQSGRIRFTCGTSAAITVSTTCTSTQPCTATPTFTLPSAYNLDRTLDLKFSPHTGAGIGCGGGVGIDSGTAFSFVAGANPDVNSLGIDYCGSYSSFPADGIPSFTVTWSQ